MTDLRDVQLAEQEQLDKKQDTTILGLSALVEVGGAVEVTGRAKHCWHQPLGATQPSQIYNDSVANVANTPVVYGYKPGSSIQEILWTHRETAAGTTDSSPRYFKHHTDHEPGGHDMMWLQTKAIQPLAVYPGTGLAVNITDGNYPYQGERKTYAGKVNLDLSSHQPASGNHLWVGIYLDSANAIQTVAGSSVSEATALSEPTWPSGAYRLAVVELDGDQTTFAFADIENRKLPWAGEPGVDDTYLALNDTPDAYTTANALVQLNATPDALIESEITVDGNRLIIPDDAASAPLNVTERSAAPSSPNAGDVYLDDGTNTASGNPGWRRYTGATWEDVGGSGSGGYPFTTLTVDPSDPDADYSTLASAITAASTDDTIEAGPGALAQSTINKRIVLIGKDRKPSLISTASTPALTISTVTGTKVIDFQAKTSAAAASGVLVSVGSTVLERVRGETTNGASSGAGILVSGSISGVELLNCEGVAALGRGLSVVSNASVTVRGGYYQGATNEDISVLSGCTCRLEGPTLANGTLNAAGTVTGWYVDGSTGDVIILSNVRVGTGKDIYLGGDEAGVKQRSIDNFQTSITDHFDDDTFSGFTWATYTGFVTPGQISQTTYPSMVRIYNTTANGPVARAFAYQPIGVLERGWARVAVGLNVRSGIRIDAGTNDDYFELFLEYTSGLMKLRYRYAIGGVVTGPTDVWTTGYPIQFAQLRLLKSGTAVFGYYTINTPGQILVTNFGGHGWTSSRIGLYHEHLSAGESSERASIFDWFINQ